MRKWVFPEIESGIHGIIPEPNEIVNLIEEVVDLAREINLEVGYDDVQELMDSNNQELRNDELIEMHEQELEIEFFRTSSIRRSNDGCKFYRRPQFN
ncbi:hypothetical protein TNCV_4834721 [Trichonephila clavipes]|nr:hypothetical protein TNCV_4834721 [Trichonephila clavipes]